MQCVNFGGYKTVVARNTRQFAFHFGRIIFREGLERRRSKLQCRADRLDECCVLAGKDGAEVEAQQAVPDVADDGRCPFAEAAGEVWQALCGGREINSK